MSNRGKTCKRWTKQEEGKNQTSHNKISQMLNGRSINACAPRYSLLKKLECDTDADHDNDGYSPSPSKRKRWDYKEDKILFREREKGTPFADIAKMIEGRTEEACRQRVVRLNSKKSNTNKNERRDKDTDTVETEEDDDDDVDDGEVYNQHNNSNKLSDNVSDF